MRKLVVMAFVSLDGVLQAPGGPDEDRAGGFKYGGWSAPPSDDLLIDVMTKQMAHPFDLLLGRKTYEIFAAHWPYSKEAFYAERLNKAKKYVASTTLLSLNWENSSLLKGNIVEEIKKLKQQKGPEIQVFGSGNLIQTLLKNDLVDELRLKIYPLTLGKGKKLFAEGASPAAFKLIDNKVSKTGVIVATYERSGEVKTGSFATDAPSEAELLRRKKVAAEEGSRSL